ncbi:hypothetical protein ACG2F4_15885 [Halalkalibaculum sp. DA3122]|uniref:hypothetical protein n=1 Tax=Halalkalibaculum sp. DA3122 TaxID=3373607 RepID=UPI003754FBB7
MSVFQEIFGLNMTHSYYAAGITGDLKASPTKETAQKLRDVGLLFRTTGSGFAVFGEVVKNEADSAGLQREIDRPTRFQFILRQQNPYFLNFTDLPFHASGREIYYFNNLQVSSTAGIHFLHSPVEEEYKVNTEQLLKIQHGNYRYSTAGTGDENSARLIYPDLGIRIQQRQPSVEGEFHFQFDLARYPGGRAELWFNGEKKESFYASGSEKTAGIFGIVDLFYSPLVPPDYRFIKQDGTLQKQVYTLPFKKRSTFWKYFIVNRTGHEFENPEIKGYSIDLLEHYPDDYYVRVADRHIPPEIRGFTRINSGEYPDNYNIFVSNQQIPLSEQGVRSLYLKKKVNSSKRVVLKSMANPGIQALKKEREEKDKYYSEVYVYL